LAGAFAKRCTCQEKETMMTAPTRSATDRLRAGFHGELISPGDDGYEAARRVWNGAIDRRPALVARASRPADVVTAVRFARDGGLPVSIRGGGHSAAGFSVADGALMLDLSAMKAIHVDPAARTVLAGPGVLWRELDAATQAAGLATTGGGGGSTGTAGLALRGGVGCPGPPPRPARAQRPSLEDGPADGRAPR